MKPRPIEINGLDGFPEAIAAVCRSRLLTATNQIMQESGIETVRILISNASNEPTTSKNDTERGRDKELNAETRALRYAATSPLFQFDHLVIPNAVRDELLLALDLIRYERTVFDEWGLRRIEPFPRTALNFHGPPGTGKTLAAHGLASKIERPILVASYAHIESMYHGEGPKNVEAIFFAAERDGAVLFIDEADSLLSRRLTNVTQGSEQAINSMRSQLLLCLEQFKGVVIFSTNLVSNYDKAFETRVRHVHFPLPDRESRKEIWKRHLPSELPLSDDVCLERLSKVDDVCGRDIKNAVIDAAMRTARLGSAPVTLDSLISSVSKVKSARIQHQEERRLSLTTEEEAEIQDKVKEHIEGRKKTMAIEMCDARASD